jgi:hypothetical protein
MGVGQRQKKGKKAAIAMKNVRGREGLDWVIS